MREQKSGPGRLVFVLDSCHVRMSSSVRYLVPHLYCFLFSGRGRLSQYSRATGAASEKGK